MPNLAPAASQNIQFRTGDIVPDLSRVLITGKNVLFLCLALTGLSLPGVVSAQKFCSEPIAPYCVADDSSLETTLQANRCEEDLNDYEEELAEYEQCVSNQLKGLREELKNARKSLEETKAKEE